VDEIKIRNLEMIQQIINRMAQNSFLLKGWSITIMTGIYTLNSERTNYLGHLLIYFSIILFWGLDSYYLMLERRYRELYRQCLEKDGYQFDFKLNNSNKSLFIFCMLAKTEIGFYFLLMLLATIILCIE
jgi:hypothetical protein